MNKQELHRQMVAAYLVGDQVLVADLMSDPSYSPEEYEAAYSAYAESCPAPGAGRRSPPLPYSAPVE